MHDGSGWNDMEKTNPFLNQHILDGKFICPIYVSGHQDALKPGNQRPPWQAPGETGPEDGGLRAGPGGSVFGESHGKS